jgi:antitoxin component YwqK of YwqJK toxin-antitoxin module
VLNSTLVFAASPDTIVKKEYYKNGQVRIEVPYVEEKKNGVVKEYYENGQIRKEIPYDDNVINGIVLEYYPDGALHTETVFTDGVAGVTTIYRRRIR